VHFTNSLEGRFLINREYIWNEIKAQLFYMSDSPIKDDGVVKSFVYGVVALFYSHSECCSQNRRIAAIKGLHLIDDFFTDM
jgi:hypothetical protein